MRIGYGRVSTREQSLDRQLDALREAGCERVYVDKISTRKDFQRRAEWVRMWDTLREGDTLLVHELDRMGRDVRDLLEIVRQLEARGVQLVILSGMFNGMNTSTPLGKLLFQMAAAFGQYERDVNRSRTLDGLRAARERGSVGGRRNKLSPEDAALCVSLYRDPNVSVASIARRFGVSTLTVRRYVARAEGSKIDKSEVSGSSVRLGAITDEASIPRNDDLSGQPQTPPEGPEVDARGGREGNRGSRGRAEAV
ncbi:recombinase family protein [Deinococcus sp. YIM 134068]|uniref:recombinase family protein n=1 Tax=Deinococcus lichenicola TaxID=3118910 RepID=UPI002F92BAEC